MRRDSTWPTVICAHCHAPFLVPRHKAAKAKYCGKACQYVARRVPIAQRLWSKLDRSDPKACWVWPGGKNRKGYGVIESGAPYHRPRPAHRVAYELTIGPIPEGLVIDHLCRNHSCVNPAHLEAVTIRENIMRGVNPKVLLHLARKCKRGHDLTPENSVWHKSNGKRRCRECIREYSRQRRLSKKEQAA